MHRLTTAMTLFVLCIGNLVPVPAQAQFVGNNPDGFNDTQPLYQYTVNQAQEAPPTDDPTPEPTVFPDEITGTPEAPLPSEEVPLGGSESVGQAPPEQEMLLLGEGVSWTLNGSANTTSVPGYITITTDTGYTRGSAWNSDPIDLSHDIDKTFIVYFGTKDGNGADGLVFTLQGSGLSAIGGAGRDLAYSGIAPSVGVELDTWYNSEYGDPSNDHIAINTNGYLSHNGYSPVTLSNLEDGQQHTLRIVWSSSNTALSVYLDGQLKITYIQDIVSTIFNHNPVVWYGFTGATGAASNLQYFKENDVDYASVSSLTPHEQTLSLGGQAEYLIQVSNIGRLADLYNLSVSGLDPAWVSLSAPDISLNPGGAGQATLTLTPTGCPTGATLNFNVTITESGGGTSQVLPGHITLAQAPTITIDSPGPNTISGASSVLFSWRTTPATTGRLRVYPVGYPAQYQDYPVTESSVHSVQVNNLSWNTSYAWTVQGVSTCATAETAPANFSVGNGIVFQNRDVDATIDRDYNQFIHLTVTNQDSQAHTLVTYVENPYSDLIINFVGSGSTDQTITLNPNQSQELTLAAHAQDAAQVNYDLTAFLVADEGGTPIVDYASIHLTVLAEGYFTVEEDLNAYNPVTLARTYVITNLGQPITDLAVNAVDPASGLPAQVYLQPSITHSRLETNQSLRMVAYPVFSSGSSGGINYRLEASGAGNTVSATATMQCPQGKSLYEVNVTGATWVARNVDWYCTNRPSISVRFGALANLLREGLSRLTLFMAYSSGASVLPHSAQITFNGEPIGGFTDLIPNGVFSYDVPVSAWKEGLAGTVEQTVGITTEHLNGGHYIVSTQYRLQADIDHATFYVCSTSPQAAEQEIWDYYGLLPNPPQDPFASVPDESTRDPNQPKPGIGPGDGRECPLGMETSQGTAGDPINTRTGAFEYSLADLSIPTTAGPLVFQRSYTSNATNRFTAPLGYGWTHNQDSRLIFPSDPNGQEGFVLFKAHSGNEYYFQELGGGLYAPAPGVCGTLIRNPGPPVTYTVKPSSQALYTFNENGRILGWTDPQGHSFTYLYNANSQLERVEADGGARYLSFTYDPQNRIQSVVDQTARGVSFTYDTAGDLKTYTDVLGQVWTYTYDAAHHLTRVDGPGDRLQVRTEYDAQGRANRQYNGADQLVLELVYNADGTTTVRDALLNGRADLYDARHTLVGQTDPLQATTNKTYDGNFRPSSITDPQAHTTHLIWSPSGANLTRVQDAAGHLTQMVYDPLNNLTSLTDARQQTTAYTYNGTMLESATNALDQTTLYTYTTAADAPQPPGLLKTITDPLGRTMTYTYDSLGQLISLTNPASKTTTFTYNTWGYLLTTTGPLGNTTWTCTDPAGRVTRSVANATGNGGTPQTDPCDAQHYLPSADPDKDRITSTVYDPAGNVVATIDAANRITRTFYDLNNRPIAVTMNLVGQPIETPTPPAYDPNYPDRNVTTQTVYDTNGNSIATIAPNGVITRTYYDANSRPITVVQNLTGQTIQTTTPPAYNPTYPDRNVHTDTVYDIAGNVIASIDTSGTVTRTYYDANDRPQEIVQNLTGQTIEISTPPAYNPSYPDQNVLTQTVYDPVGNAIATIDPNEIITRTYYDELNRPKTVVQNLTGQSIETQAPPTYNPAFPDRNVTTIYAYDMAGNRIGVTDPNGIVTRTYYDVYNRPYFVVQNLIGQSIDTPMPPTYNPNFPDRNVITQTYYDDAGNAIATIDPNGVITRTYYDALNRPNVVVRNLYGQGFEVPSPPTYDPGHPDRNVRSQTTYDGNEDAIATIDNSGTITRTYYDQLHRSVSVVRNLTGQGIGVETPPARNPSLPSQNVRSDTIYDAEGNVIAAVDPVGVITRTYLDGLGRGVTVVQNLTGQGVEVATPPARDPETPDHNVRTDTGFDGQGNPQDLTDANGVVTRYEYDALGRLTAVVENYRPGFNPTAEINVRTEYRYDAAGNRVAIQDANQHESVLDYDKLNRLASESDPLSHATTYLYDASGQQVSKTDANGATTHYVFDGQGRLQTIDYPAPDADVTFVYDAAGNRLSMSDGVGSTSWGFDALGRPTTVTDSFSGTVGYVYDSTGNRASLTYPDSRMVSYQYDALRRMTQVTAWDNLTTQYTYDVFGRQQTVSLPNGVISNSTYDDLGRLLTLTHINGNNPLASYQYTYDPVGNRTQLVESLNTPAGFNALAESELQMVQDSPGSGSGSGLGQPIRPLNSPDLDRLPLSFVPNVGQSDSKVRYQVQGLGGTLFFTSDQVVLSLPNASIAPAEDEDEQGKMVFDQLPSTILRLRYLHANHNPEILATNPLPGVVNYLRGPDPADWRTKVPTYASVVYRELYPGIELRFEGNQGQLESSYLVSPGAHPSAIRWHYLGGTSAAVDAAGNLVVSLPAPEAGGTGGTLTEQAPIAWQERDGQRVAVPVQYSLGEDGSVGFALPQSYDPGLPLVIDPTLTYSTYLGGGGDDEGHALALDGEGHLYVAGMTYSSDFPTQTGYQGNRPLKDAFITKLNAEGTALLYSTYLGGSDDDEAWGLALDPQGRIAVVGETESSDFPLAGAYQTSFGGGVCSGDPCDDAFVAELTPDGSALRYATYLGTATADTALAVAVDGGGYVYVAGFTQASAFPTTTNALDRTYGSGGSCGQEPCPDGFFAKINPALSGASSLLYSTYLGGSNKDKAQGIALDGAGRAYVVGHTQSSDFPTKTPYQASRGGNVDAFLVELNPSLAGAASLLYGTFLGGSQLDYATGVDLDPAGHVVLGGYTQSANFPLANALQATFGGGTCGTRACRDAFLSELNLATNSLSYSTYLGGAADDEGWGLAVDGSGNALLTGYTRSTGFPVLDPIQSTKGADSCTTAPCADAFVAKVDPLGSLVYATYLGGSSEDYGVAIAPDEATSAYLTGYTLSTNFPTTPGAYDLSLSGTKSDAFVAKISTPLPAWEATHTYTYDPLGRLTAADDEDGTYFHYTYDGVGNRLTETTPAGSVLSAYDDANRLVSVGGVSTTWDNNGNLLSDGVSTYTYDHANRLNMVVAGTDTSTYAYNGLGERLSQTVNGVTTHYSLDLAGGLSQVLADGTNTYLYGTSRVAQAGAGGMAYFLGDGLGSVRQLANGAGEVDFAQSYAPYGAVLERAGEGGTSYGFAGEWTDPSGLMYLRARYLSPGTGRFITEDPLAGNFARPITQNHWVYADADPINRIDPSGTISRGPEAKQAQVIWDELLSLGVLVQKDWGETYQFQHIGPGWKPIPCGWKEGKWSIIELETLEHGVLDLKSVMGSSTRFRNSIGFVIVVKKTTCGRGCTIPFSPNVEFTDVGTPPTQVEVVNKTTTIDKWTVVHEFGHAWDRHFAFALQVGLEIITGGFTDLEASLALKFTGQCDLDSRLPGCNTAGYFYGGVPPAGSDEGFNRGEDFAESVAAFTYPVEAEKSVAQYAGTLYEKNLYYTLFPETTRYSYIDYLIHIASPY